MRLNALISDCLPVRHAGAMLLAVLVSATAAALIVGVDRAPGRAEHVPAGAAAMAMLGEEHALANGYTVDATQAQREANRAAEQEVARVRAVMEVAAVEEKAAVVAKVETKAPAKSHSVAQHEGAPAEPLQLATMMSPPPVPVVAPPPGNPVTRRARAVVAVVERVPSWLRDAADWVVDLPAPSLPRWRFASL